MITQRIASLVLIAALVLAVSAGCASPAGAPEDAPTTSAPPAATSTGPIGQPSSDATAATIGDDASVTISAVGDISLGRQVVERMAANGAAYPFALVAPLIDGDIGLANLEGPLTERGQPWPKSYNFRTPPRFAFGLLAGHFNVMTLANNHIMDFGADGLLDTAQTLDAENVEHSGAGASAAAAHAPAISEVRGIRVAILGYVATPDEGAGFSIRQWASGPTAAGVAIGTPDAITTDVTAAKRMADFVIVAVHAGDEYRRVPNATQRALADAALAAGADAYIGAHSHVVQPVEMRGHQLIAWSLGNFIFDLDSVDLANIPAPRVSLILRLTLTKGAGVTAWSAVPVTLDEAEDRPRPATVAEAAVLQSLVSGG